MIALTGIADWTLLAWISSAVAMLLGQRPPKHSCPDCELRELMLREQNYWKWARRNPGKAIERFFR